MKEKSFYAVPLLLSLSMGSISGSALKNKVKGALVGAALGDTLARATEQLSVTDIKELYGPEGITSLAKLPPCDLLYEPFKNKRAPFSTHTVLAHMAYETAIKMRTLGQSPEAYTDLMARKIIDQFGPHKYLLDPHFELRRH